MNRMLVLSVAMLLTAQAAPAAAPATAVSVVSQLSGGNRVSASCTIGKTGLITGTGSLSGTNASNGRNYSYPFSITRGSTTSGKLVLTGKMTGTNYPVTLTASVPRGAVSFAYVVNGNTYTLTGTGTVTVR